MHLRGRGSHSRVDMNSMVEEKNNEEAQKIEVHTASSKCTFVNGYNVMCVQIFCRRKDHNF